MNEQSSNLAFSKKTCSAWGVVSFLAHAVLEWTVAFLLGEHITMAEVITFSILIGVINGVTAGWISDLLPSVRLRVGHWIAIIVVAIPIGWAGVVINGDVLQTSTAFVSAYVLAGLPLSYVLFKMWASRPVAPKGHPDNIPN